MAAACVTFGKYPMRTRSPAPTGAFESRAKRTGSVHPLRLALEAVVKAILPFVAVRCPTALLDELGACIPDSSRRDPASARDPSELSVRATSLALVAGPAPTIHPTELSVRTSSLPLVREAG